MPKPFKYQTLSGIHDILPEEQKYYHKIYQAAKELAEFYGFGEIQTPIFELTELFERGVGAATDIVQKQMYSFRTQGGDFLTLRPEGTAPIARAYLQHGMANLPQPVKLWMFGPFYRYERPQAGRFRQFWQVDFEIFGEKTPALDALTISLFAQFLQSLKIKDICIEINSIGDGQCRPYYKKLLVSYFKRNYAGLCSDCKRRFRENPLRILDCKEERCRVIAKRAPQTVDHLCEECKGHFKEVLEFLDELGLPYELNPRLVRGLDYYTKTVFEIFIEDKGDGKKDKQEESGPAKNALAGGGRYDNLIRMLSSRDAPGVGGAAGVERLIDILKARAKKIEPSEKKPDVFIAQLGGLAKRKTLNLLAGFKKAGIWSAESLGKDSLKAQLKLADKVGVNFVLILGHQEVVNNEIIIRDMNSGRQETVKLEKVVELIKAKIKKQKSK